MPKIADRSNARVEVKRENRVATRWPEHEGINKVRRPKEQMLSRLLGDAVTIGKMPERKERTKVIVHVEEIDVIDRRRI
jgi:hypothetical protein